MSDKGLAHLIVQDYQRVKQEIGHPPTRDEYCAPSGKGKYPKGLINETFGGWTNFLRASGIQYSQKGRRDKQELRREYYDHLLREIERYRSQEIVYAPATALLVIGDLHSPYGHPDYIDFLFELHRKYSFDRVCCVGDEVDNHAISFHEKDPDLLSAGPELEAAIRQIERLYKVFPQMDLAESNHGSLVFRKGKHHGLPRQVLASYHDILQAPPEWRWHHEIEVSLSNGRSCVIHHSYGMNVLLQSKKRGRSLIQGHHHTDGGVQWWGNTEEEFFAASSGCGIDNVALAFAYNKNQVERPRLGALIVINGIARFAPMLLDKHGRWNGVVP